MSECTDEAMVCPDGSAMGRTGQDCEFEECPTDSDTAAEYQFLFVSFLSVAISVIHFV